MRFLIDTQLPIGLASVLRHEGHLAEHILDLGMGQSSDRAIWEYACTHEAVIVTKDEIFCNGGEEIRSVLPCYGFDSEIVLTRFCLPL